MRLFLLFLALIFTPSLQARTWRVEVDGSGDAPFIQAVIDSSLDGDLVLVGPGTYFEHLNFNGKDIWLKSFAGPEVTILDGNWEPGALIVMTSGETRDAIVEGFTIMHGTGEWDTSPDVQGGGGIYIDNAWPTVRFNVFQDNEPGGNKNFGGALHFATFPDPPGQPVLIQGNLFIENRATNGGAINIGGSAEIIDNVFLRNATTGGDGGAVRVNLSWWGPTVIERNQFWENSSQDHGGAIEAFGQPGNEAIVENNMFVRNIAFGSDGPADRGAGGAIGWRAADGVIRNNTFYDNRGFGIGPNCRAGSVLFGGLNRTILVEKNIFGNSTSCAITILVEHDITLVDNLFWGNGTVEIQDVQNSLPGNWEDDNVFEDPLFCGPDADNFTVSVDSPALNHENGPIGVFTNPGCGPGVPVERTTWGSLKMKFGGTSGQ